MRVMAMTLLLLAAPFVAADVTYSAAPGFEIRIVAESAAPRPTVWARFLRVDEWWNAHHSWFGKAEGFSLDTEAGGCFCERSGDKSVLHMTVAFVDPGSEMRWLGGLGPLQGMGLNGAMTWQFEDLEDGGTRITHVYRVSGYHPDGLTGLAPVVDAVQSDQVARLKARADGA